MDRVVYMAAGRAASGTTGEVVRPEVLGDILASGMTLLPLFADTNTNRETLRLLSELDSNARANVFDPRFRELYLSEDVSAVDGIVKAVVEDYRGFDNIAGWDIVDEPGVANFPILGEIVAALTADGSDLAQATLKTLGEKSPRGMVVTLKLLRLARATATLEECLVREYRAALEVFASDEFREGVRAAVIDKDRNPKWSPPGVEDVTPEMQAPYFAEIGADVLKFPDSK
ncbi:MAG: enoyl-CoA hydratase/isomerase family protein, partial [Bradyrhizobium sp.]